MEKKPTILSLEDNLADQSLLIRDLGEEYDVLAIHPEESNRATFENVQPDLILLNADSKNFDAAQYCQLLREQTKLTDIPILILSSQAEDQQRSKTYLAGGDDFLLKPLTVDSLKNRIRTSLERTIKTQPPACNDAFVLDTHLKELHQFLTYLISAAQLNDVAYPLLECLDDMGLKGAIIFHPTEEIHSSIGPLSELEKVLLQQATLPYPTEFSARYIWGGKYLGAIIQNMPLKRSHAYQPICEILSTLFTASNEKIKFLTQANPVQRRQTNSGTLKPQPPSSAIQSIKNAERRLNTVEENTENTLADLGAQLQDWLTSSQLAPSAQLPLQKIISRCLQARIQLYDQCADVREELQKLSTVKAVENALGNL